MKRLIASLGAALAVAACSADAPRTPVPADPATSGWMAPPTFESVEFPADAVIVSGKAEPNRRIVLIDRTGTAAAASADASGSFAIRLPALPGLSLWRVNLAQGAEEARTGEWLAVSPADRVAATLRAGASARPAGPAGLLATADYDGGGLLVGGRATPGQAVQVDLDGGSAQTVLADARGWHQTRFAGVSPGAHRLRVRTRTMTQEAPLTLSAPTGAAGVQRAPAGLRIDWPTPGGSGQATWIFNLPAGSGALTAP